MGTVGEAPANPTQIAGVLRDGMEVLDLNGTVDFVLYSRVVLPLGGYVFWLPGVSNTFKGSLHYSQEMVQNEDETYASASIVFSSEDPITLFTDSPVNTIFVANVAGFRFAFSQQQGLYEAAGPLFHYFGKSIAPAMLAQLLDHPQLLDPAQAVTSNSLALWLGLNGYASRFYDGFTNKGVPFVVKPPTLFPAFIVDTNEQAPYGAVHIGDNDTRALQATPLLDINRSHSQLVSDKVRITLYGLQNDACLDFIDTVNQYSMNTDNFGIMNMPVVRDANRTQPEIQARAMKKVIDYEISYYQRRVADVARSLIKAAQVTYILAPGAL